MTTLAQDTFVRANQSGWGTASDSEVWSNSGASSTQSINSNKGVIAATGGSDTHNHLGTQTVGDQDIQVKITINDVNDVAGIEARFSAANGSSSYKLVYYANDIHLNKAFQGNNFVMATYGGYNLTVGTTYHFRIRCVGSAIQAMFWPDGGTMPASWMLTATDTAIASGGFAVLAASSFGSGVQFSQFTVSDISLANELSVGFAYLNSTLAGDATLQGYTPGGVHRGLAPPSTLSPYVMLIHQASTDIVNFGAGRAYSDMLFQVKAVGPASNTAALVNAVGRIDTLITTATQITVSGGIVRACFRYQPLQTDELVDGELWSNFGGLYRLYISAT